MATAHELIALALSQDGDRYIFGAEVSPSDSNPSAFDCSEIIQWACARLGVRPTMPDGTWNQVAHARNHGLLIPVAEAIKTPGAMLFKFSADPFRGVRPPSAHVALSQGNGKTIEARGSKWGVGQFSANDRGWTHAGLVPGLSYSMEEDEMAFTLEEIANAIWYRKVTHPITGEQRGAQAFLADAVRYAYDAKVDAAVARRLAEQEAQNGTLTPAEIAAIGDAVAEEIAIEVALEIGERIVNG